jgi:hypothetical protein
MSNRIGSATTVPVQTGPAVTAEESKSAPIDKSHSGVTSSSEKEANTSAARKQGKETTSLNMMHEGLHQKDLHKKLPKTPNAEKGKSTGTDAHKPESLGTYADAVKEADVHGKVVKQLEDRLKTAPDSEKPGLRALLDVEKRLLDHARWKMEVLRPHARKLSPSEEQMLKAMEDSAKNAIRNMR